MLIVIPLWLLVLAYLVAAFLGIYFGVEFINGLIENSWLLLSGVFLLALFLILILKRTSKGSSAFIKFTGCISFFIFLVIYGILAINLNWDYNANKVATDLCLIVFSAFIVYHLLMLLSEKSDVFSVIGVLFSIAIIIGAIIGSRTYYVSQDKVLAKEQIVSYLHIVTVDNSPIYEATEIYQEGNNFYPTGAMAKGDGINGYCNKGDVLTIKSGELVAFSADGYTYVCTEDGTSGLILSNAIVQQGVVTRYDIEYANK